MAVIKRSDAFDHDVWVALRDWADGDGISVSAVVSEALRDAFVRRAGVAAMDEWRAEHGAFQPAELAWADSVIDGAGVDDATWLERIRSEAEGRQSPPGIDLMATLGDSLAGARPSKTSDSATSRGTRKRRGA